MRKLFAVMFVSLALVGCDGCISSKAKESAVFLEEAAIQFVERVDAGKLDPDQVKREQQLVEQLRAQARMATALRNALGLKRGEVR